MRVLAIVKRIFRQFLRDKRTLALLIIAPLFLCTLLNYVFDTKSDTLRFGVANNSQKTFLQKMTTIDDITVVSESEAKKKIEEGTLDAYLYESSHSMHILIAGNNMFKNGEIKKQLEQLNTNNSSTESPKVSFYYGNEQIKTFDYVGPILIGTFIFFFVFLISGVSFLRERTNGTLERLLASPIKRYEIVLGYLMGYGLFTIFQSLIIAFYCTYVLDIYNIGSIGTIVSVCVLIALSALSLGTFLSTFANNELQMIQFIPLVIVPQIFFSGIFPIEGMYPILQWLSKFLPLTYGADSLVNVTMKGDTLLEVLPNLSVLLAFTLVFATLNIVSLKKHRSW